MKNYSNEVINSIQNSINEQKFSITKINSFDELPKIIRLNGVVIKLEDNNGIHSTTQYFDQSFNVTDGNAFRNESLGKFYSKDWKLANKGFETFNNYYIFETSVKGVEIKALIRDVSSVEYGEEDIQNYYSDIIINDVPYTIMKAFTPTMNESFSVKSCLDEEIFIERIFTTCGIFATEESNEEDDSSEEPESFEQISDSEELF